MKILALASFFAILLTSCAAIGPSEKEKHYPFTGKVVSLSPSDQTAAIDGAAIPNYMDAMTMDYPFKSKADFQKLHAGDLISATVNVSDSGTYNLSNVKVAGHSPVGKK